MKLHILLAGCLTLLVPPQATASCRDCHPSPELSRSEGASVRVIVQGQNAVTFFMSATDKANRGDKHAAILDYGRAIEFNPRFFEAYLNRGNLRDDVGDWHGAMADYSSAIKINPTFSLVYVNRGLARLRHGDKQGAISDYSKAIQVDPSDSLPLVYRGRAKLDLEDRQGALIDFNKAIEISPQNGEAYFFRAVAYAHSGGYVKACLDLRSAAGLGYADASEWLARFESLWCESTR